MVGGLATPTPGDGRQVLKPATEWVWSEVPVYEPLPDGCGRPTFERHGEPDLVPTRPGCEDPVGLQEVFGAASAAALLAVGVVLIDIGWR